LFFVEMAWAGDAMASYACVSGPFNFSRAGRQLARQSLQNFVCLGQHQDGVPHLLRETRRMHREKPHKLLQVGVTPTPATNLIHNFIHLINNNTIEKGIL
jgi:hypothetical protein